MLKINIAFIFLLGIFLSCSEKEITSDTDTNNATDLEFTDSPIDLETIDANFAKDIFYDDYENTSFDIFLPNTTSTTGLVIYMHGGGFVAGDKEYVYADDYPDEIKTLLTNNISVATINYRLLETSGETEGVIKCLNSSKRALQYIKANAEIFNIDKDNIVLAGNSAGAGTALWLGTNDDLKDLSNSDAILQESTRVKAVALRQTQSSYDIEDKWINDVFIDYGLTWTEFVSEYEEIIGRFYGVSSQAAYATPEIEAYRKSVDMLEMITADDPEIWASNVSTDVAAPTDTNIAYHHAFHVREIKEKADEVGVPNVCFYGKNPTIYSDPSGESFVDFCIRKINE